MLEVCSFSIAMRLQYIKACLGLLWGLQDVFPPASYPLLSRACNTSQARSTFAGPSASICQMMLASELLLLRLHGSGPQLQNPDLCDPIHQNCPTTWPNALLFHILEEVSDLWIRLVRVITILCSNLDQIQQFLLRWKCYHSLCRQFCQIYRSQEHFASGGFVVLGFPEEMLWCLLHMLQCHMLGSLHCLAYLW